MIRTDLHVHTTYCDGKSTPGEIVRAALDLGLVRLGFSGHAYAPYDADCCMSKEATVEYKAEIAALKKQYAGRLEILCGVEQDYYSEEPTDDYDFVIGSVHYLFKDGEYIPVDWEPWMLREGVEKHFGGDYYAFAEQYFATVADVVGKTGADIIGHFDLLTKYNEQEHYFDEKNPRYIASYTAALDSLLKADRLFEINTGAISRGYRSFPYPNPDIIAYIKGRGGKLILSSDSHRADTLCYQFDKFENLL